MCRYQVCIDFIYIYTNCRTCIIIASHIRMRLGLLTFLCVCLLCADALSPRSVTFRQRPELFSSIPGASPESSPESSPEFTPVRTSLESSKIVNGPFPIKPINGLFKAISTTTNAYLPKPVKDFLGKVH